MNIGGISATSHPLASAAARQQYARGGNAVDAAVAAAFALAVVEPQHSGIAGQAHMLVRVADGRTIKAYDAYSVAPQAARPDMFTWIPGPTQGNYRFHTVNAENTVGYLSVGVPGALLGFCALHQQFGVVPFKDVMRPAIRYARDGFTIDRFLGQALQENAMKLSGFPGSRRIWLDSEGQPKKKGDTLIQRDLGTSLELVSQEGPSILYEGSIGEALCMEMTENGGIIEKRDLVQAYSELLMVKQPVTFAFGRWTGYGPPPPSAGGTLVGLLLKIFHATRIGMDESFPVLFVEALRIAFQNRIEYFGKDYLDAKVWCKILEEPYLSRQINELRTAVDDRLSSGRGVSSEGPEFEVGAIEENTSHHSHIDGNGNCVAITQSLGDKFGSGITLQGTGILLNNAMKLFDPRPEKPNAIAPFRKPLSSMSPLILHHEGGDLLSIGSPSGTRIISAVVQTLVHNILRMESLEEAVEKPRIHLSGDEVQVEKNLATKEFQTLESCGYDIHSFGVLDDWFGAVQAVKFDVQDGVFGAADPRRNGSVMGFPGGKDGVTRSN